MAGKKNKYPLTECHREASVNRFCCNNQVCRKHLREYTEREKAKIDPLVDDVNKSMEKFQSLTLEQISQFAFAQLNRWRTESHALIDGIHQRKTKEIEEILKVNKWKFDEHKRKYLETMIELQDDTNQQANDVVFERMEVLGNQLREINENWAILEKNLLSIDTRLPDEGLVTISSEVPEPFQPMQRRQRTLTGKRIKLSSFSERGVSDGPKTRLFDLSKPSTLSSSSAQENLPQTQPALSFFDPTATAEPANSLSGSAATASRNKFSFDLIRSQLIRIPVVPRASNLTTIPSTFIVPPLPRNADSPNVKPAITFGVCSQIARPTDAVLKMGSNATTANAGEGEDNSVAVVYRSSFDAGKQ